VGLSFDQEVTDVLTLFTRLGYQDQDAYPFELVWSAGFNIDGCTWGRENDVFGAAFGMAHTSNDYEETLKVYGQNIGVIQPRTSEPVLKTLDDGNESFFEAYYSIYFNDNLFLSPDIQIVNNSFGVDRNDSTWIFGLRGQVWF
jgi:carbohydrate-selective porin OprB